METKQMYHVDRPFGGYPWGVECIDINGGTELHGPFSNEREAVQYAHVLNGEFADYTLIQVVKVEIPSVGLPIRNKT